MTGVADWLVDVPIAHRGLFSSRGGPVENSVGAVRAAVEHGYGIEIDVRLSRDATPWVVHDPDLLRTTGTAGTVDRLADVVLAERRLVRGGGALPRLGDVLDAVGGQVGVVVEIKPPGVAGVARVARAVASVLDAYDGPCSVQSFDPRVVRWFASHRPDVDRGLIAGVGGMAGSAVPAKLRGYLDGSSAFGFSRATYLAIGLDGLRHPAVVAARERGVPVLTWTVRTDADLETAQGWADNHFFERDGLSELPPSPSRDDAAVGGDRVDDPIDDRER